MLGQVLSSLSNPATAAEAIAIVAQPALLARVNDAATEGGVTIGTLVASKIRHVIDHGGEDLWLDLLGVMSSSASPGVAAVERMLTRAFPDPIRVRISRRSR